MAMPVDAAVMNAAAMNAAAMNAAQQAMPDEIGPSNDADVKRRLNTSIYEYFLKEREVDLAELMTKSGLEMTTEPPSKNPQHRQLNGDTMPDPKDEKSKRIQNLPVPSMPWHSYDSSFLHEWWAMFFEMFKAQRLPKAGPMGVYLTQAQSQMRTKHAIQQQMINNGMPQAYMRNGVNANISDMQRQALINNNRSMPQNMQNMHMQNVPGVHNVQNMKNLRNMQQFQAQHMNQTNMQREGSEQKMPSSPMSGENAPSPKRPRTDGGNFNGQQMNNGGRPPMAGMPMTNGNPAGGNMMVPGAIHPHNLAAGQFNNLAGAAGPPKNVTQQQYAQQMAAAHSKNIAERNMGNMAGAPNMQGSPMMPAGANGMQVPEFYGADGQLGRGNLNDASQQPGGQSALHDYQVQLILLEKQNKRRLLQARAEQNDTRDVPPMGPGGMVGPMGIPGYGAPGMSPQGSRTGSSPNPDQMKRGTPQLGQNSPLPDGSMPQARASPMPMNFDGSNQMNAMFMQQMGGMKPDGMQMPNGNMMRPPGFNMPNGQPTPQQIELMRQNGGRLPNGMMPGQMPPGMVAAANAAAAGAAPGGPGPEHPQQRSAMPPPQAPAAPPNNGRAQPPSPSPAAPPTPSQANKPNPKKKDTKDTKKKAPKKNNNANNNSSTAANSNSNADNEQPPTPTPQTPITPVHPKSFNQAGQAGQAGNPQAANDAANAQGANAGAQPDASAPFGSIDQSGLPFETNMDFGALDSDNVLDGFDFSAFLNQDADGAGYDFDPSTFNLSGDGVEANNGEA